MRDVTPLGIAFGVVFTLGVQGVVTSISGHREEPTVLAADHLTENLVSVATEPGTIIIRILSRAEFAAMDPLAATSSLRAAAYTSATTNPCVIYLPEGWVIEANLSSGAAEWINTYNNIVIPHEILHCLRGPWHPPWKDIPWKDITKKETTR